MIISIIASISAIITCMLLGMQVYQMKKSLNFDIYQKMADKFSDDEMGLAIRELNMEFNEGSQSKILVSDDKISYWFEEFEKGDEKAIILDQYRRKVMNHCAVLSNAINHLGIDRDLLRSASSEKMINTYIFICSPMHKKMYGYKGENKHIHAIEGMRNN